MLAVALLALAVAPVLAASVTPTEFEGNFKFDYDGQPVCEAMFGAENVTSDMVGFKVDIAEELPTGFSDSYVDFTVSGDGYYLDWEAAGAKVLAVIVKGGSNYNWYDYGMGSYGDEGLQAPDNKAGNMPEISNYLACYKIDPVAFNGCEVGDWKNALTWPDGYAGLDFDATFGVNLFTPDITLSAAINLGGGGANALARQATAALLNAVDPGVNYPLSAAQVKEAVQDAVANGTIEATKNTLEGYNQLGCPLLP
jgi:hypothetical protein